MYFLELLREGRPVDKISIIHRGQCSVFKKVPGAGTRITQVSNHCFNSTIKLSANRCASKS